MTAPSKPSGVFSTISVLTNVRGSSSRKPSPHPVNPTSSRRLRSQRVGIDRYVFMAIPLFSVSERSQSGGSEGQIHAKGQRPGYRVALDVALLGVVGLEVRPVVEVIPREIEPHAIDADAGRQQGR